MDFTSTLDLLCTVKTLNVTTCLTNDKSTTSSLPDQSLLLDTYFSTVQQEYTSAVSPRGSHLMSSVNMACKGSCSGFRISIQ